MSGFGIKSPLCKASVIEDFVYTTSKEIFDYLSENLSCESRIYRHVETMENLRTYNNETPIKNCLKLQMFAYFPDGSIQVKEYLCSCCSCLNGDFISSSIEKGTLLPPESSNDTIGNVDNLPDSDFKEKILHHDILFDLLIPGSVIVLYSLTNARELFFV